MTSGSEYTFACPECGESIPVNTAMRDALVENGCVVCSASVPPTAFSETTPDRQSV
ncbi:hypothetical protein [Halorientalis sp. IM1011]|uniref:DUF7560 family zinc ribbon protein n=1 Tax=Halorientalis sp. IM1011 TaxID=1932360 RepID=UPI0015600C9A|nr:hypothetical protein [Halorientalis sp. IM1011]